MKRTVLGCRCELGNVPVPEHVANAQHVDISQHARMAYGIGS